MNSVILKSSLINKTLIIIKKTKIKIDLTSVLTKRTKRGEKNI